MMKGVKDIYISSREREIIHLLLENPRGMTISQLAKSIDVSSRTVHREMKGVEQLITSHQLTLKKITGAGMFIEGSEDKLSALQLALFKSGQEFTPKERQELILCNLLNENNSVKLSSLANDLYVTVATISNDLNKIEEWLTGYDLQLLRKKGYGIALFGSEKKKRAALGQLLKEQLNEYEFLTAIENDGELQENRTSRKLLEIMKLEKMTIIGNVIRDMEKKYGYTLADDAFMTFTIHLSLAIERILQGEVITMEEKVLGKLRVAKEFPIAKELAQELQDVFDITIQEMEIGYITMYLQGAGVRNKKKNWLEESSTEIIVNSKKLIQYVAKEMGISFEKDQALFEGLLTHIEPAIYRIEKQLNTHNPLAIQTEKDFPILFKTISEGLEVSFPKLTFSKGEIAYLVLHFGSSKELYDTEKEVSALVLCASGIGTSKMLASRITKEVKEITHIDVSSLANLKNVQLDDYDIILSTVDMQGFPKQYLAVTPLLAEEEIALIRTAIQQYTVSTEEVLLRKFQRKQGKELEQVEVIKRKIANIHLYSEITLKILHTFRVHLLPEVSSMSDALKIACQQLWEKGLVENHQVVADELTAREQLGSVGIPNTSFVLQHCRSQYVKEPIFVGYQLPQPLLTKAMDGTNIDVTKIYILLAPTEVSEVALEVLSLISATMIEDEQTMNLFSSGNQSEIGKIITNTLYENLQKK